MEQKLLEEIKNLPEEIVRQVSDFIEFLKEKKRGLEKGIPKSTPAIKG